MQPRFGTPTERALITPITNYGSSIAQSEWADETAAQWWIDNWVINGIFSDANFGNTYDFPDSYTSYTATEGTNSIEVAFSSDSGSGVGGWVSVSLRAGSTLSLTRALVYLGDAPDPDYASSIFVFKSPLRGGDLVGSDGLGFASPPTTPASGTLEVEITESGEYWVYITGLVSYDEGPETTPGSSGTLTLSSDEPWTLYRVSAVYPGGRIDA